MKKGFDAFEIEECVEYYTPDRSSTFVERFLGDDIEQERLHKNYKSDFWTLYGHLPTGGVLAIGDFKTEADAQEILELILNFKPAD